MDIVEKFFAAKEEIRQLFGGDIYDDIIDMRDQEWTQDVSVRWDRQNEEYLYAEDILEAKFTDEYSTFLVNCGIGDGDAWLLFDNSKEIKE